MKLTRLELSGFKSFADTVQLPFQEGVTAIVGPNGCGKSNISDAVRWVLGEQRSKVLRGARMEEIIFQGTASRKPVNIAEVSLYFDNGDGILPISYSEVVITRRLSRSGQSDYLINGSHVRLRDIQDLLRGTGLGADASVVIEARMVDRLLSDNAEERRSLFEEAAEIGFYRDRKTTTERRLQQTTDDLQRLEDLVGEVQTQVRSLARQKGKAERGRQLTEERFAIVITLARSDLKEFERLKSAAQGRRSRLQQEIPAADADLERLERKREQRVQRRIAAEAERNEVERRLADLRVEVEKLEGDLKLADERLQHSSSRKERALEEKREFEKRIARTKLESEAALEAQEAAQKAHNSVQRELDLRSEAEDQSRSKVSVQRDLVRAQEERLQELAETQRALRGERSAAEAELEELGVRISEAEERFDTTASERDRNRDLTQQSATELAQLEEQERKTRDEVERARHALAATRESETAVRVERRSTEEEVAQLEARRDALEELERSRAGLAPAARLLLQQRDKIGGDKIYGPLSDFLATTEASVKFAERVLGDWLHAVLVEDEETVKIVRKWHAETKPGPLMLLPVRPGPKSQSDQGTHDHFQASAPAVEWVVALTAENKALDPSGSTILRSNGAIFLPESGGPGGPLARKTELETVRSGHAEAMRSLEELNQKIADAVTSYSAAEKELNEATRKFEQAREATRECAVRHDDNNRNYQRGEREWSEFKDALERTRARIEERRKSLDDNAATLGRTDQERYEIEADVVVQRRKLEEFEEAQETARERRVHWQVEEAQVVARETAAKERHGRARADLESSQESTEALERELTAIDTDTNQQRNNITEWKERLKEGRVALQELESAVAAASDGTQAAEASVQETETKVAKTREKLAVLTQSSHELELEMTEVAGRESALLERIEAEWQKPYAELAEAAPEVEGDAAELGYRAQELADKLESLGPVNPLAVEEHEQERERLEFITTQRDDLIAARADLSKALKEIDQTARRMFLETFEAIRENFGTAFGTLFEGGQCDLRLSDENDPLESDIEIHASPRGKKMHSIHLLSTGERALVASALLFAIYLTKPSPFCLLDEVDAPLDDANIVRFIRLLEEFKSDTQFIVITHNPRTMQIADSVYGITMQEPGVSTVVGVRLGEAKLV